MPLHSHLFDINNYQTKQIQYELASYQSMVDMTGCKTIRAVEELEMI